MYTLKLWYLDPVTLEQKTAILRKYWVELNIFFHVHIIHQVVA